jgi:hypothetical protein
MRTVLAAALLLVALPGPIAWLGSGSAEAQSRHGHAVAQQPAEPFRPSLGLPLPQIGLPLPSIGLPLPSLGLPPQGHAPDRTESSAHSTGIDRAKRFDRSHQDRSQRFDRRGAFVVPLFGLSYPYVPDLAGVSASPVPTAPPAPEATGGLRLDLQPGVDPRIFVDSYFVGLLSDTNGELALAAGPHVVEFQDEGYEPLRVNVDIRPDEQITYRGVLKRIAPTPHIEPAPAPLPASAPPPTTIYVIPGCYIGNVPPRDAALPANCSIDRTVVLHP